MVIYIIYGRIDSVNIQYTREKMVRVGVIRSLAIHILGNSSSVLEKREESSSCYSECAKYYTGSSLLGISYELNC